MERQVKVNKRKKLITIVIIIIAILGIAIWKGIEFYKDYNNPNLIGKWISQETGKEVEFTEDGTINVGLVKMGDYKIISTNIITYDIEGHSFEMTYKIGRRSLIWGLVDEEEVFERKGL